VLHDALRRQSPLSTMVSGTKIQPMFRQ
jgi:hypothetical protein